MDLPRLLNIIYSKTICLTPFHAEISYALFQVFLAVEVIWWLYQRLNIFFVGSSFLLEYVKTARGQINSCNLITFC